MSYYWLNRQEILQKAKGRYSNEKATEYYKQKKEESRNCYKNLSEEKRIKEYQKKRNQELIQYKKEVLEK